GPSEPRLAEEDPLGGGGAGRQLALAGAEAAAEAGDVEGLAEDLDGLDAEAALLAVALDAGAGLAAPDQRGHRGQHGEVELGRAVRDDKAALVSDDDEVEVSAEDSAVERRDQRGAGVEEAVAAPLLEGLA